MRKIFLACPYASSNKAVVEQRFDLCNAISAQIVRNGAAVFSQVSMSHPINAHFVGADKENVGKLWKPVDQVFMEAMDELIVVDTDGWKESAGVAREMDFFTKRGSRVSLWSEVKAEFAA